MTTLIPVLRPTSWINYLTATSNNHLFTYETTGYTYQCWINYLTTSLLTVLRATSLIKYLFTYDYWISEYNDYTYQCWINYLTTSLLRPTKYFTTSLLTATGLEADSE